MPDSTPARTIRKARPEDSPTLRDVTVRSALHWGYTEDFFDFAPGWMNVPPDYIRDNPVYVLEESGRIVGYYGLTVEAGELVLDRLFVDRDRIGTGCGKQLWLHAVGKARGLGHREMIIGSEPNAASFYEAMGAVRFGEKPTANPEWTVQMYRFTIPEADQVVC